MIAAWQSWSGCWSTCSCAATRSEQRWKNPLRLLDDFLHFVEELFRLLEAFDPAHFLALAIDEHEAGNPFHLVLLGQFGVFVRVHLDGNELVRQQLVHLLLGEGFLVELLAPAAPGG